MSKQKISFTLLVILLLSVFWIAPAQAQAQEGGWSDPYRLSSEAGKSSEGYLVADQYGYVHCFWTETLFENGWTVLKYSRFDGATWSKPNDIYVATQAINNVSPVVDKQGILHIVWSEGYLGSMFYAYAPANNAVSVQNWARPLQIKVPAGSVYFRVDSKGVFHNLYINATTEETGVYYIRSEDRGLTWSESVWLDPDIRSGYVPDSLNFALDDNDGLHAVWFYGARGENAKPDWVRYIHSLDGGHTWSAPFLIDQHDEATDHRLTNASPIMAVQGQTVHVIWAAGSFPYRHHRFSTDAGRTWSEPVRIFGELHGQAFDGFTVDRSGRVHFLSQIRYPMGIYHAYWDQTRWSKPALVYLIAAEGEEADFENRVHAHHTLPVIRAGNQLVLTFGDGPADPNRRLFVMHRILDDIAPLEALPTPTPTATLIPPPSQTPTRSESTPTPTADSINNTIGGQPLEPAPKADLGLQFGIVPVLLLLAGTFAFWLWYKHNS